MRPLIGLDGRFRVLFVFCLDGRLVLGPGSDCSPQLVIVRGLEADQGIGIVRQDLLLVYDLLLFLSVLLV